MGAGASAGLSAAVANLKDAELLELLNTFPEAERQKIKSALNQSKPVSKTKARLSFTADLGGVCPGIVQAADAVPFEGTYGAGDRIEVVAPDLKEYHGKFGSIVADLGMTPNGPRIAVQLDDMGDQEVQIPPVCLVRAKAAGEAAEPSLATRPSLMRGDCMAGNLEFIPYDDTGEGGAAAEEGDAAADEEEEEEDEDSGGEDLPPPPPPETRKQRTSVSAEAYGAWNKKVDYTPVVIPKSEEQKVRIKETLQKSWMFQNLEEVPLKIVINAMQEKVVPPGTRLINQGDDGDVMFIIEEGELECYKKMSPDEPEKLVKTCKQGDVFGELALLYFCPRAASCQTKDQCTIWQLDRETFNAIVKEAAEKANNNESYEGFSAPPKS